MLFRYRYAKQFLRKGSVLDLGCGYGYIAALFEDYQYLGVDYYDNAVSFASQHCPGAEFRVMSVPPLDFQEGAFDNVICAEMIEHLPQDKALPLLKECYRVLKPGGILFLSTPNAENRLAKSPDHYVEYTRDQLRQMLTNTGFGILHQSGLSIDLLPHRYDKDSRFAKFRSGVYRRLTETPSGGQVGRGDDSRKNLIDGVGKGIKAGMRLVAVAGAKGIIYLGYLFPGWAEYQVWVCTK